MDEGETPKDFEGKQRNLVVMGSTDCEIKLQIDGIKMHSNSKKIKLGRSVAQMRPHPSMLALKEDKKPIEISLNREKGSFFDKN